MGVGNVAIPCHRTRETTGTTHARQQPRYIKTEKNERQRKIENERNQIVGKIIRKTKKSQKTEEFYPEPEATRLGNEEKGGRPETRRS